MTASGAVKFQTYNLEPKGLLTKRNIYPSLLNKSEELINNPMYKSIINHKDKSKTEYTI